MKENKSVLGPRFVLLVEDDASDIRIIKMALSENEGLRLQVARDGEQAIRWIAAQSAAELPDLIVLDLNMPRKNGRELLAELKADSRWREIPVVVLTTSDSARDIETCRELGADRYYTKPRDLDEFLRVIQQAIGGVP